MASIRELTQNYIVGVGSMPEIDADRLFESILPMADLLDAETAQKRCARQDFCVAYNELGYYKSINGYIVNENCEDAEKLSAVAKSASDAERTASNRRKKFGKRVNEIVGQIVFDVDDSGNISIAQ